MKRPSCYFVGHEFCKITNNRVNGIKTLTSQVYLLTDKPQYKAKINLMQGMQPHISRAFRGLKWTSIVIGHINIELNA